MSLVHLGQQLLEAVRSGQDDDVKALMANGAPFTTDWVRLICFNYGIIFRLICNEMRVNLHLLPRNWDCQLLMSFWTLSPCSGRITVMLRPHIDVKGQVKVKETLSGHLLQGKIHTQILLYFCLHCTLSCICTCISFMIYLCSKKEKHTNSM